MALQRPWQPHIQHQWISTPLRAQRGFTLSTYFLNGITDIWSLSFYNLLFILKMTLQKYFHIIFKCLLYYMARSQLKQPISCCLTIKLFPLWGFDKYCSSEQFFFFFLPLAYPEELPGLSASVHFKVFLVFCFALVYLLVFLYYQTKSW